MLSSTGRQASSDTLQITAGGGKIRPPGTFSFVSGVIFYSALAAAYLLYGALKRGRYPNWLLYSSGFALVVAIGVSGSRSVLLAVLVVISSMLAIIFVQPSAINRFGRNVLIVVIALGRRQPAAGLQGRRADSFRSFYRHGRGPKKRRSPRGCCPGC